MSDLLTIGMTGLMANQYGLNVTGQNITNVNTPGYNRQIASFNESTIRDKGNGVLINGADRLVDDFTSMELRNHTSAYSHMSTFYNESARLDNFMSNEKTSIMNALSDFFDAIHSATNDPASIQNREVLLNQGIALANRFDELDNEITSQSEAINQQIISLTNDINGLTQNIAKINEMVRTGTASPASLDQRDELLRKLSSYIGVTVVEDSSTRSGRDGAALVSVALSSGETLVSGGFSSELVAVRDSLDPNRIDIGMKSGAATIKLGKSIDGGQIGGLLNYRNQTLEPTRNDLGKVAIAIADEFNRQHAQGIDLDGNLGGHFFKDINDPEVAVNRVMPDSNNMNTGNFDIHIDDIGQLSGTEYIMKFSGPNAYTISRKSDGVLVTSGTLSGPADSIAIDGFTLNYTGGSLGAGDRFLLAPSRSGAKDIKMAISTANKFALAAPIRATTGLNNTGSALMNQGQVTDINNSSFSTPGQLNPPIRIEFLSPTSYQIVNATTLAVIEGPISYNAATDNPIFPTPGLFDPGYTVSLTGSAHAGDEFTVGYNTGGVGDNRNGLMLAALDNKKSLNDGNSTFREGYNQFAGKISTDTHFAEVSRDSSKILLDQTQARRDELSGVNLDEEAANLVRYQKSYQASAQLIAIGSALFSDLLNMIG